MYCWPLTCVVPTNAPMGSHSPFNYSRFVDICCCLHVCVCIYIYIYTQSCGSSCYGLCAAANYSLSSSLSRYSTLPLEHGHLPSSSTVSAVTVLHPFTILRLCIDYQGFHTALVFCFISVHVSGVESRPCPFIYPNPPPPNLPASP